MQDARPEVELLLCCARTRMDSARAARIGALCQENLDWSYLLQTAGRHGLAPLVHRHLNTICPAVVPEKYLSQLQSSIRRNAQHNLFLNGTLVEVLNLFQSHRIKAVPYKGPTLALSVYGNLSLRQFGDLDLLIRPEDVSKAVEVLCSEGYAGQMQLTAAQETTYLKYAYEYGFTTRGGAFIELHWSLVPRYFAPRYDTGRLWERLQRDSSNPASAPSFSPEDLLLYLCMHGSKHRWQRLAWIADVAELIGAHKKLDWEQALREAEETGTRRMLYLGLFLASDLLGAQLPQNILQRVQSDGATQSLAAHVRKRLFRKESFSRSASFEMFLFHLRALEKMSDKARYCLYWSVPTLGDWDYVRLPDRLFFLYYLTRPVRLIKKYVWDRLKRLAAL